MGPVGHIRSCTLQRRSCCLERKIFNFFKLSPIPVLTNAILLFYVLRVHMKRSKMVRDTLLHVRDKSVDQRHQAFWKKLVCTTLWVPAIDVHCHFLKKASISSLGPPWCPRWTPDWFPLFPLMIDFLIVWLCVEMKLRWTVQYRNSSTTANEPQNGP